MFLRSTSLSCTSQNSFVLLCIWTSFLVIAVFASPLPLGDETGNIRLLNARGQCFSSHEGTHGCAQNTRIGIDTPEGRAGSAQSPTIPTEPYTPGISYNIKLKGSNLEYWSIYLDKYIIEAIPDPQTLYPHEKPLVSNARVSLMEPTGPIGLCETRRLGDAHFKNPSVLEDIVRKLDNKEESSKLIKMPPANAKGGLSLDYGRHVLEYLKKEGHIQDDAMNKYMTAYKDNYGRVSKNRFGVVWDPPV